MIKVVCINNKNKPVEIPALFWLEEQEIYTIDQVFKIEHNKQKGEFGVTLKEITLPKGGKYETFNIKRFRPATPDDFDAIEAVQDLLEELEVGETLFV